MDEAGNTFGRTSRLRLRAEENDGDTRLGEVYGTMPFRVMRPFALPREELVGDAAALARPIQAMVMTASAGLLEGDRQDVEVAVGPRAALQVTSQAFDKVHRMDGGGHAERTTRLEVAAGAYLDYRPQALIPYAGSAFHATTEARLADATAGLVYEEVLCCGRAARGERFAYRAYTNRLVVRVGDRPVYLDNAVFEPDAMDLEGLGLFEGFSHLATLLVVNRGVGDAAFASARACLQEEADKEAEGPDAVAGGVTRLASGDVAVRLLGNRAQRLGQLLDRVRALL